MKLYRLRFADWISIAMIFLSPFVLWHVWAQEKPMPVGKTIVFFGDSLTADGANNLTYVYLLGEHHMTINKAVSAHTTATCITDLATFIATGVHWDIAIIMCGSADVPTINDPAVSAANIMSMVTTIKGLGKIPVVIAPPPITEGGDAARMAHIAALAPLLAAQTSAADVSFVNAYEAFYTDYEETYSGSNIEALYEVNDHLHIGAPGDAYLATIVAATIDAIAPPPHWGIR